MGISMTHILLTIALNTFFKELIQQYLQIPTALCVIFVPLQLTLRRSLLIRTEIPKEKHLRLFSQRMVKIIIVMMTVTATDYINLSMVP